MPIYEYRCDKGHSFDVRQSFADDPATECEVCGAPVQRVFHPVAVHFKGSGFYNTDYGTRNRSREKEAANNEAKSDGAKETSKDSAQGDSKSDSGSSSNGSKADAPAKKKSETKA